ncbi:hypothetical protein [Photobacterium lutimaris]|uniref:Uncharacterized protein n=1 Tax=Photobacterium lutimaris TaxID=388278 RepID=A0A2T3J0Q3_9GAMM|nr:hypothetical protein [Photobacterium lutimaris]PSU34672.1 hypothetical protein C9I99_06125 [Photobacterium lutimaris]TDR71477.1 hypothetical protein DFP78_1169 [Photobacterium lutimaris]
MTEKTLKERLPVGSPRNKVEYLADEFERVANDLYSRLQNKAVNLLANPQFNEIYESQSNVTDFNKMTMTEGQKPSLDLAIRNGRGSMMVSDSWAVELPYAESQEATFFNTGRYFSWADTFDRASGVLECRAKAFTLYQVATVPFNGLDHDKLKARFSITGWSGTKVKVGIAMMKVDLDGTMKVDYVDAVREYVLEDNVAIDNPMTVESGEMSLYMHGVSPRCMVAPFLEISDARGYCYVYNAALWHATIHGDDPKAFINQTNPHGYSQFIYHGKFPEFEFLDSNLVTYKNSRHFPFFHNAQQHFIINMREKYSAKVIDIKPDSITVQYNDSDYQALQADPDVSHLWYQYSMMPIGVGFYK